MRFRRRFRSRRGGSRRSYHHRMARHHMRKARRHVRRLRVGFRM